MVPVSDNIAREIKSVSIDRARACLSTQSNQSNRYLALAVAKSPHVLSPQNSLTHGGGITVVAGTNVGDHDGLGVPPQTVLQQPRQFTVPVQNVVPAFAIHLGTRKKSRGMSTLHC